jgi:hypothetical protein
MTPEDRLRQAIEARTSGVEPSADALTHIEEKLMETQKADHRKRWLIGLGSAAAIAALVVAAVVLTDGDDDPVSTEGTSTTTSLGTTTTTEPATTTTTPFATVDADLPVFPDPTTSQRFDDPVSVATAFAAQLVGFTNPTVGPFAEGDSRSGEIEIRGIPDGAPTVVLVRQLDDDAWWVIGAETDAIRLATPAAREAITSPQPLLGQAYAYEGNVSVRLYADGTQEPIGETFVTGRGDGVLGDFSGEIEFDPGGATHGVLVLTSNSGDDGAPIEAQVVRVRF